MKLEIRKYHALPCELEYFTINGIHANKDDFGFNDDHRDGMTVDDVDEDVWSYGCVNNYFTPDYSLCDEAMSKYNITEDEFNEICDTLEDKLCIGECNWCV